MLFIPNIVFIFNIGINNKFFIFPYNYTLVFLIDSLDVEINVASQFRRIILIYKTPYVYSIK